MEAAVGGAALGPPLGGAAAPGPVALAVSSSLSVFRAQKRFSTGLTIAELKCKLELVVGIPASLMELQLFGLSDEPLGRLDQDEALLGNYPVSDGCRLHVTDRSGSHVGAFEDLSQVPKYEIPDSEYDKRPESLRSFLRQRGWGRFAAGGAAEPPPQREEAAGALPVGSRCLVRVPGQPGKRGTIMYDKPTSSRDAGWACATMSPWASTTGAWAAAGTSSASPSTEPSSDPRASPPGTSPRRTTGWTTRCEGHGGDAGTRGTRAARGGTRPRIAVFSLLLGVRVSRLCPLPPSAAFTPKCPQMVCVCPPNPPRLPAGRGPSRGAGPPGLDTPLSEGHTHCWSATCFWPRPRVLATPPALGGGVASFVPQPMGGRAEEEAGPEAAAGQSRCQRRPRPVSRDPPARGHRRVAPAS